MPLSFGFRNPRTVFVVRDSSMGAIVAWEILTPVQVQVAFLLDQWLRPPRRHKGPPMLDLLEAMIEITAPLLTMSRARMERQPQVQREEATPSCAPTSRRVIVDSGRPVGTLMAKAVGRETPASEAGAGGSSWEPGPQTSTITSTTHLRRLPAIARKSL